MRNAWIDGLTLVAALSIVGFAAVATLIYAGKIPVTPTATPAPAAAAEEAKTPAVDSSGVGALADAIQQKRTELDARARALDERDALLGQREKELTKLRDDVARMEAQVKARVEDEQAARDAHFKLMAGTLAQMGPGRAAETLKELSPEETADILAQVAARARARILDAMPDARERAVVKALAGTTPAG